LKARDFAKHIPECQGNWTRSLGSLMKFEESKREEWF